jgi:RNA polymerase sigma factor (TIGR02999 family)
MRRILVDFARARKNIKRGAGMRIMSLEEAPAVSRDSAAEIIDLDRALQQLSTIDPRKAQIVELRFFGGLSEEETAEALKVSTRTIQREWDLAKSFLLTEMSGEH